MERTDLSKLQEWKNKPVRKPLLVLGVRQCGKTWLIKQFAESEFEDFAYFNLDGNEGLKAIFDYDFDTARILDELGSVARGKPIIPGRTLVIFDEVQDCPRAVQSLKYFCENVPQLHVIAAGSLLGVALRKKEVSFPVGKVERLELFPMSFEEFVIADGGGKYIDGIKKLPFDREISQLYTVPLEKYLRNYYIVGGMPEAVRTWVETHDYARVEAVQDQILHDYADDFAKHAGEDNAIRMKQIWDSVPTQLATDNNKFIFSHVKQGARAKDLEDSLEWLVSAGLVHKLYLVPTPQIPLEGMKDCSYFKLFMSDVGLLRKKANVNYRTILEGNGSYIQFKGAFAENYVMTQLKCLGIPAYFWRTKADAEVDFISDYEGVLFPIEVKSADNTKAKSLHLFCGRFAPKFAFKSSLKNVGLNTDADTRVWSLPLYALFRLKDYIAHETGW
ncbi:MAG: ATP-binding protein [Treponema sp.]|nr:ATP-binding protein [Treponema sp.]